MSKSKSEGYAARSLVSAILFTVFAVLGAVLLILGATAETFNVLMFVIGIIMLLVFGFISVPLWIGYNAVLETKKRKQSETAHVEKD